MDYSAELLDQDRLFAAALRGADWSTPVPTCPEWTVVQAVRHVGRGHRWAAQIVRERASAPVDPRQVPEGRPPDDEDGALQWLADSDQALLDAVTATGPDTPVWTFLGPRPAQWWIRRRVHESTVHRADVELALGLPYELAVAAAADGIGEWLDLVVARRGEPEPLTAAGALRLHPFDQRTGWTIHSAPDGVVWTPEPGPVACTVGGSAQGLFLALLRRQTAKQAGLEIAGDATVWERWLERTPF